MSNYIEYLENIDWGAFVISAGASVGTAYGLNQLIEQLPKTHSLRTALIDDFMFNEYGGLLGSVVAGVGLITYDRLSKHTKSETQTFESKLENERDQATFKEIKR